MGLLGWTGPLTWAEHRLDAERFAVPAPVPWLLALGVPPRAISTEAFRILTLVAGMLLVILPPGRESRNRGR